MASWGTWWIPLPKQRLNLLFVWDFISIPFQFTNTGFILLKKTSLYKRNTSLSVLKAPKIPLDLLRQGLGVAIYHCFFEWNDRNFNAFFVLFPERDTKRLLFFFFPDIRTRSACFCLLLRMQTKRIIQQLERVHHHWTSPAKLGVRDLEFCHLFAQATATKFSRHFGFDFWAKQARRFYFKYFANWKWRDATIYGTDMASFCYKQSTTTSIMTFG